AQPAGRHRDLHAERDGLFVAVAAETNRAAALHGPLHGGSAADGELAAVAVEPAGDGLAGEADDAARTPLDLEDERVVEAVEVARNFFGAAAAAEQLRQAGGEGGEAGDVGEQHAPERPLAYSGGADQVIVPVLRQVGAQDRTDAVSLSRDVHLQRLSC